MLLRIILFISTIIMTLSLHAEISVMDDSEQTFTFYKPLTRIVSLAPHATELLYAAGADKQILGTVSYSDFPEAAKKIPRIGGYKKVDYEQLLALQPELVIYWQNGNPENMIEGLRNLNLQLFNNEPESFESVAVSIRIFGKILGTEAIAEKRASEYLARLAQLRKKYAEVSSQKVTVFYQVWNQPLMTINHEHLINDVIEFCGGVNVFADIDHIAPTIDIESVLKKNPQVIIAGMAKGRESWLPEWQRWKTLDAVKKNNVYGIDASQIVRQTPRILDGAEEMCDIFQRVRNKLNENNKLSVGH